MNSNSYRLVLVAFLLTLSAGCLTRRPAAGPPARSPELARAETFFQQGRHAEAIVEAIELQRKDPLMPGLADLQGRIMNRLSEERRQSFISRDQASMARMTEDAARNRIVPETYHLRRYVRGETDPMLAEPSRMQQALERPVSVHLTDVGLNDFISQIGMAENINIVADSDLTERTFSIHAEETPLNEILEFVGRNLGVSFSVGDNLIWVTAAPTTSGQPLETRMYRLRKGLSGEEGEAGPDGIDIINVVNRFVGSVDGSDIYFNFKGHVLLVKNTRANLALIETLIHALDISPPQVLIEARFMNAGVSDLRELGVDWVLGSAIATSHQTVMQNGQPVRFPRTQIEPASPLIGFSPFEGAAQGLNLTFSGILTDPQFQAVVHAMEKSGKSRTLSVPRVTTVNNREAIIRIGTDIRYFDQFDVVEVRDGTTDAGAPTYVSRLLPTGSPQVEETGIELIVTPSVGADLATINLRLKPEISDLIGWEYYETQGSTSARSNGSSTNGVSTAMVKLPIFERRFIDTELVVRSGETVVMGGLVSSRDQRNREGVPILSSIPLIGPLFRRDFTETVQDNLIIFVTATLISDVGESLIPLADLADVPASANQADPTDQSDQTEAPVPADEALNEALQGAFQIAPNDEP